MIQNQASPFVIRWGILSTGNMSRKFSADLLKRSAARGTNDIEHKISAVASRTLDKAQSFVNEHLGDKVDHVQPWGSLEELYNDPNVDVVYISTPNAHHYRNVKDTLLAGKPVLVEKPIAITAEQIIELADIARSKKLFLMEAVWTKFFPITYKIQNHIQAGEIGKIKFVEGRLWDSVDKVESAGHRSLTPALAGGSLMDLGAYPWTWIVMSLYQSKSGSKERQDFTVPRDIKANQILTSDKPGEMVDDSTIATWTHDDAVAVFKTSMVTDAFKSPDVVITGTKGKIDVDLSNRPGTYTICKWKDVAHYKTNEDPEKEESVEQEFPDGILGFAWEADEVARCIRDGKIESERMPLDENIQMLKVFDEIRQQGGLKYPSEIEKVDPEYKI